jgi:hypothetical protein
MQEQALSIIHRLPEHIQLLVLEKLMPQGYDALQRKAYADSDISKLLIVDKYIRNLIKGFINNPALLWGPQLRRILDALGFEELREKEYLRSFDNRPALTPKQLALSIINFDYPAIAKKLASENSIQPKNQNLTEYPHPIISHLHGLLNMGYQPYQNMFKVLENFKLNLQRLNDTLPPIFLILMQLSFITKGNQGISNNEKYKSLRDELLNKVKNKLPEITIDNNFLQELSLSLLLHWPNAKKMLTINPDYFNFTIYNKVCRLAHFVLEEEADKAINYLNNTRVTNQNIQKLFSNGTLCKFLSTYNQLKGIFPHHNIESFVADAISTVKYPKFITRERAEIMKSCSGLVGKKNIDVNKCIRWFLHLTDYKWHILAHANYTKWKEDDLIDFLSKSGGKFSRDDISFLNKLSPDFLYSFLDDNKEGLGTMQDWISFLCSKENQVWIMILMQMGLTKEEYSFIRNNMQLTISIVNKIPEVLTIEQQKKHLFDQINPGKKEIIPTAITPPPSDQDSFSTSSKKRRWTDDDSSSTSSKSFKFFDNTNCVNNSTDEIYKFFERAKQAKMTENLEAEQAYLHLLQTKLNNYLENLPSNANEDLPKPFSCE